MPKGFEVFDLLDTATQSVLQEINSAIRSQRVPPKLGSLNLELSTALTQSTLFDTPEDDALAATRARVQRVVANVPLDAFKRDKVIKQIRDEYNQTQINRLWLKRSMSSLSKMSCIVTRLNQDLRLSKFERKNYTSLPMRFSGEHDIVSDSSSLASNERKLSDKSSEDDATCTVLTSAAHSR